MLRHFHRLPLFWKLHLGGWLLFTLSMLPIRILVTRSSEHPLGALETELAFLIFRDAIGVLLCLGLRALYRLRYFRSRHSLNLGIHLVAVAAVTAALDVALAELCFQVVAGMRANLTASVAVAAAYWLHLFVFFVWSLLYFFLGAHLRSRQRVRFLAEAAARQREAELLMLRAHLEPHFIFNALNAISILSQGNPAVAPVIRGCSEYLRFCLGNRDKAFVPLGEELDAITQYLTVEKVRFGSGLVVEIEVDPPGARQIPVPGIFLMPLVENAIKHRNRGNDPLHLRIEIRYQTENPASLTDIYRHPNRDLTLQRGGSFVSLSEEADDGPGSPDVWDELIIRVTSTTTWTDPAARPITSCAGVGLSTLRRRLELLYPGRAQLVIGPKENQVVAEICIQDPLRVYGEGEGAVASPVPSDEVHGFASLITPLAGESTLR